tara:strand:- start:109 stop:630 length:522 start_codon:yes stop_codon:yes gene_type:complete
MRTEANREPSILSQKNLILAFATLGPIGVKLPAPGTFGSVFGLLAFVLLWQWTPLNALEILLGFGCLALLAIPICGRAEKLLGKSDPGEVILDEFVSQPLVFLGTPWVLADSERFLNGETLLFLLSGFLLFRLFDVAKPIGIKKLQSLHGGLGIVADDLAAAFVAGICLWIFS